MKIKVILAMSLIIVLLFCAGCSQLQTILHNLQSNATEISSETAFPDTEAITTTIVDAGIITKATKTSKSEGETTETVTEDPLETTPEETVETTTSSDVQTQVPEWMLWTYADFVGFMDDDLVWTADTLAIRLYSSDTLIHTVFFNGLQSMKEALEKTAAYMGIRVDSISVSEDTLGTNPLYRLSFTVGGNEDTEICRGAVVLTDEGACFFCTETYADFYEEDKPAIDMWMDALMLTYPEYIEPTRYSNLTRDQAADLLCGLWVFENDTPDEDPVIYCFTEDGKVYLSYEDYVDSLTEEGVFYCGWEMSDGVPCYLDFDGTGENEPRAYEIRIFAPGDRIEILWDGEQDVSSFLDCSSNSSSGYLEGTTYDELYGGIRVGKAEISAEDGESGLVIHRSLWISSYEDSLIRKYNLENSDFDDDYELIPLNRDIVPEYDEDTLFELIEYNEDGSIDSVECSAEEFMKKVEQSGGFLVDYYAEEGYLILISEMYVP